MAVPNRRPVRASPGRGAGRMCCSSEHQCRGPRADCRSSSRAGAGGRKSTRSLAFEDSARSTRSKQRRCARPISGRDLYRWHGPPGGVLVTGLQVSTTPARSVSRSREQRQSVRLHSWRAPVRTAAPQRKGARARANSLARWTSSECAGRTQPYSRTHGEGESGAPSRRLGGRRRRLRTPVQWLWLLLPDQPAVTTSDVSRAARPRPCGSPRRDRTRRSAPGS
jgi:hypothetical protein